MFLETTGNMLHFEPQKNKQKKSICIQCYSARAGHSTFPVFHDTDYSMVVGVLDEHPVTAHTVRWVVSESLLHRHAGVLSAIRTEQQPAQVKRQCRRIYESLASLQCLGCLSWEYLRCFFFCFWTLTLPFFPPFLPFHVRDSLLSLSFCQLSWNPCLQGTLSKAVIHHRDKYMGEDSLQKPALLCVLCYLHSTLSTKVLLA